MRELPRPEKGEVPEDLRLVRAVAVAVAVAVAAAVAVAVAVAVATATVVAGAQLTSVR